MIYNINKSKNEKCVELLNLKKAYLRLKEVSDMYNGKNDIIRDSLIQRFEFTYELTRKPLKEFMKYLGVTLENSFPRTIYKKAC